MQFKKEFSILLPLWKESSKWGVKVKVIKFGGSSLTNSQQIKRVFQIVQADSDRRIVVVSAPGKRHSDDEKVTDL